MKHEANNTTQLTGSEKVLWMYSYKFHIETGKTAHEATMLADAKIQQKRNLGKSLTYKF